MIKAAASAISGGLQGLMPEQRIADDQRYMAAPSSTPPKLRWLAERVRD